MRNRSRVVLGLPTANGYTERSHHGDELSPVAHPGARTHFTISRPVLQRLVDGRTLGLAIRELGSVVASLRDTPGADGAGEPRLLFDVEE